MSHFTVMVIGDNPEQQLAPYHEFECTGDDNEFVVDVDETDEKRKEYTTGTTTVTVSSDGTRVAREDCYRDPTPKEEKEIGIGGTGCGRGISWSSQDWGDGRGYRAKVHCIPHGCQEEEWTHERMFGSFMKYLVEYESIEILQCDSQREDDHKYGFVQVDADGGVERVIRRTNPNDKWDWYVLGGRFRDSLRLKSGSWADSALKRDIDVEGMMNDAETKALGRFDEIMAVVAGRSIPRFEDFETDNDIETARRLYHEDPVVVDLRKASLHVYGDINNEVSSGDRELHTQTARRKALVMFAFLRDGKWAERGSMGWWACVSDENGDWESDFENLWAAVSDDETVSIFDCHI